MYYEKSPNLFVYSVYFCLFFFNLQYMLTLYRQAQEQFQNT